MAPTPEWSDEVPEADALEQSRGLVDDEDTGHDPDDPSFEVPDADAYEQRQRLEPVDEASDRANAGSGSKTTTGQQPEWPLT
ncbi:MAG: hypothetical protein OSA99_16140 [Acidimicrobiales bacterium]|nr:hypothetical protein [Acidimicrobiales bacterium]